MDSSQATILIVDDTPENLQLLVSILTHQGYDVRPASDGEFALQAARTVPPDLILLDVKMPDMDGYTVCKRLKADKRTCHIPIIFISALDNELDKVKGFEMGGVDYITKPFHSEEVLARVNTHLSLQQLHNQLEQLVKARTAELQDALTEIRHLKEQVERENIYLREEIKLEHNFEEIIGESKTLKTLLFKVQQVASTDSTVLITGETGTGKELIARAIHDTSPRKDRSLVKVNCSALPANLIESELFGHEKGAFTGASAKRIGRFELAHNATLFLDEIGELPRELQPKLLRVIQEGELERVGSSRTIPVNVRVIAATNRNLEEEVRAGNFRQDLFYRLNVYPLSVPPLRERIEDIPFLVHAFVRKLNKKLGTSIEKIPQRTMDALQKYDWPGNIRELENAIERAVITTQGKILQVEIPDSRLVLPETAHTLEAIERAHILKILALKHWRIEGPKGAAVLLGLNPSTLRARMRKLDIHKPR